eukprot:2383952-Amphidinium_carterae.1
MKAFVNGLFSGARVQMSRFEARESEQLDLSVLPLVPVEGMTVTGEDALLVERANGDPRIDVLLSA